LARGKHLQPCRLTICLYKNAVRIAIERENIMGKQRSVFCKLIDIDNCIDLFFKSQDKKQPIIMFGAGFALQSTLLTFERHGLNIVCICDNDQTKIGMRYNNQYDILDVDEVLIKYPDALFVITATAYFYEIQNFLKTKVDPDQVCNIDFESNHYFSGRDFRKYLKENIDRFDNVYDALADEISQTTFLNVSQAHISGERSDFEKSYCNIDDWYLFKSKMAPNSDSVYLDCGAYDGDTVLLFHNSAPEGYQSIIAFEPDITIQNSLRRTIQTNNIHNVEIISKGLYNFNGKLRFTLDGFYSNIEDSNTSMRPNHQQIEVEAATLDSIIKDRFVDIIKFDIEGAEYKALLGAQRTIQRNKPRLAVCLYHSFTDFIEIPELIHEIVPEYELFIRHHSKSCTDTILYAIPSNL